MKICYLIPEWPGQSHVWAWREICHLRDLGIQVEIFSTRKPSELGKHAFAINAMKQTVYLWPLSFYKIISSVIWAAKKNPKGLICCIWLGLTLPVQHKNPWRSVLPLLLPACRFAQEVHQRKIDHLHTPFSGNCAILCMFIKRILGRPFSLTVVSEFSDWGGAMQEKFDEASFITVVGEWMIETMRKDFPSVSPNRYCVTRHGVDTKKWMPRQKDSPNVQPKRILSIGRLAYQKGFLDLIEAAALVKDRGLTFELRIVGAGPEKDRLLNLISQLNMEHEISLLGSLSEEECLEEAQSADIFALATHSEGLPVVFQEAMATELATVGTNVGGVPDIIVNEVNGLLVPPHDPRSMCEAIIRLLTDDGLRNRLAKAGRQTIVDHFDSRIGAAKLATLIIRNTTSH